MKRLTLTLTAAAVLAAIVTPAGSRQRARTPELPAYVLNQWGGVVSCDLERNPLVTAKMVAYCSGAWIPSADPAAFDCALAEVQDELEFCALPRPAGRR